MDASQDILCHKIKRDITTGANLAQWICLCQVHVPSKSFTLLSIYILIVSCEIDKNKQREAIKGPFKKRDTTLCVI